MWSTRFDKCIACGTIDSPYCAKGLCSSCYQLKYRVTPKARWSKDFYKCVKCGRSDSAHASKGICQRCYQLQYQNAHLTEIQKKRKLLRERNREIRERLMTKYYLPREYSDSRNTFKKLLLVVVHRLGIAHSKERIEKAKSYIRSKMCVNCKRKYLDFWKNDFKSVNVVVCQRCNQAISGSLEKRVEREQQERIKAYKMMMYLKKKAIQYELEFRLNKPFEHILKDWYVKQRMSSPQIYEKLVKDFQINDITVRGVRCWLDELGILRPQVKANRLRVVTKRIDYDKRIIDYKNRHTDYNKRSQRVKANMLPSHPHKVIRLPIILKKDIKAIATKSRRTMSEVIRDILEITGERIPGETGEYPRWRVIEYGLKHLRDRLLKGRLKSKKSFWVSLMYEEKKA